MNKHPKPLHQNPCFHFITQLRLSGLFFLFWDFWNLKHLNILKKKP